MHANHGDNEAVQQGLEKQQEEEKARKELQRIIDLNDLVYALEDQGDEQENAAEHLLDLAEASGGDTPKFPSVSVSDDGTVTVGLTKVQVNGVREFSHPVLGSKFVELASRHTLNAAAYRREAKRIRRLIDEEMTA